MAARMEQQDDAACVKLSAGKGAGAYQQCRRNLIGYRQQALVPRHRGFDSLKLA
jgi:hypothetical protein